MNNRIRTLVSTMIIGLACACSAPAEYLDEAGIDDEAGTDDLGQTAQALTVSTGYGAGSETSAQCSVTMLDTCLIPTDKVIPIRITTGNLCSPWMNARISHAINLFTSLMALDGWTVTGPNNNSFDLDLGCGNVRPDNGPGVVPPFAGSRIWGWTNSTPTIINGIPYLKAPKAWVRIVDSSFPQIPGWSGLTQNQKDNVVNNIILHELFHCAGLGHQTVGGRLMSTPLNAALVNTYKSGDLGPMPLEDTWLTNYVP